MAAPPPAVAVAPPSASKTTLAAKEIEIKDPAVYKGDVKDYTRFVSAIKNIMSVRVRMDNHIKKIIYVGSLLEGTAATW